MSMDSSGPGRWRWMAGVYVAYFGGLGLMGTWWPLAMASRGMAESTIGLLFGLRSLAGILSQPWIAGQAGGRWSAVALLRVCWLVTLLGAGLALFTTGAWPLGLVLLALTPTSMSILPLCDGALLQRLSTDAFARLRLWGSIGYGGVVGLFGLAAAGWTSGEAGEASLVAFALVTLLGVPFLLGLPGREAAAPESDPDTATEEGQGGMFGVPGSLVRSWVGFLVTATLHFAAIGVYNTLLSLHFDQRGMAPSSAGLAVALAVACEVLALRTSGRWRSWLPARGWYAMVCLLGIVRWLWTALAPVPWTLVAVQSLHMVGFGVWLVVSMDVLGRHAPSSGRARLQGWFAALVVGLGGTLGATSGGWAMQSGVPGAAFLTAAGWEVLALVALAWTGRWWGDRPA
jgi:hypothetical protein